MAYLSNEKLVIVGAGGMIGSNMVQSALMLGLTPNICLYDIYEPGVHGVFDEIQQCAFPGANVTYTVDPKEAFTGAKYIISSGGAPRKDGMTREDLLKGNCKIAAEFGDNIKKYCPDVEHVVVIFNPADVTALTALIHSGLKPNQLTSLAALDSTRLQQALAHEFGVQQDKVTGAHTYGGHGEQMAVFASQVKVDGKPLSEMGLSAERWEEIKHRTGWFKHHQAPWPQLIPEPCLQRCQDDRSCHGRRTLHSARRLLRKLRQVWLQKCHDGHAYHYRQNRRALYTARWHRRGNGCPQQVV